MKIKDNLKIILVALIVLALFLVPTYVFAAEDLKDFWGDSNTGWEDITDGTGSGNETGSGTGSETGAGAETGTGSGNETGSGTGTGASAGTGTGAGAGAGTQNPTGQEKDKNTNNKPESYDKAGIAEDTMMVVAIITLVMIAICAYNKVNEYKGI